MIKKTLNIALILILLVTVTGFTSTTSLCECLRKTAPKACCKKSEESKRQENKCCKKVTILHRLESDLSTSNTEVNAPYFDLYSTPLFIINEPLTSRLKIHSGQQYAPPIRIKDIPVLIQCFRN